MASSVNNSNREAIINALIAGDRSELQALVKLSRPIEIFYKRFSSDVLYKFDDGTGVLTKKELAKCGYIVSVIIPEEGYYMPKVAYSEKDVEL